MGLAKHLYRTHTISSEAYYLTYLGNKNKCLVCNKETNFISLSAGYREYYSRSCQCISPLVHKKQAKARKQTYKDNPEIQISATKRYKETMKCNPSIGVIAESKRQQTLEDNPSIQEQMTKNMLATYKNSPSIAINRSKKQKQTYKDNPEILDKLSINLRNKYNKLQDVNSKIPYHLYIIKNNDIIKIGVSGNPVKRLNRIQKSFSNSILIYTVQDKYNSIMNLEKLLHKKFNSYCKVQPKYTGPGRTEWFDGSIIKQVIQTIDQHYV